MTVTPRHVIEPYWGKPYTGGLVDAAYKPEGLDGHWQGGGITYQGVNCDSVVRSTTDDCDEAQSPKTFDGGIDLIAGDPFTLYASMKCAPIGNSYEDLKRIAEHRFLLGEDKALTATFSSGTEGNTPKLGTDCTLIGDEVSAVNGPRAVGLLEEALADVYGTAGVLHAPRSALALMSHFNLALPDGDRWVTPAGNIWSFSPGYHATAPDGSDPIAGAGYLYATGMVTLLRGPISVFPPLLGQALTPGQNVVTVVAERTYAVAFECACFAVQLNLTGV